MKENIIEVIYKCERIKRGNSFILSCLIKQHTTKKEEKHKKLQQSKRQLTTNIDQIQIKALSDGFIMVLTFSARQHYQTDSMDLAWLWLIIPGGYILISIIFLCWAPFHRKQYPSAFLTNLIKSNQLLCIGHRGGGFQGPENTLQLFAKTAEVSHMFELDVCETLDHQLVVHHDSILNRTTGIDRTVKQYNAADLPPFKPQIQAFGGIGQAAIIHTTNNKIPLLDQLFTLYPEKLMNIDLKTPTESAIQQFARLVKKHNREYRTVWGSMGDKGCTELRQSYTEVLSFYSGWEIFKIFLFTISGLLPFWPVRLGVLDIPLYSEGMSRMASKIANSCGKKVLVCIAFSILKFFNLMSHLFISHLKKRGILAFYWILNERQDWENAISTGCNGIMTDLPTQLSVFLKQKSLFFDEAKVRQ